MVPNEVAEARQCLGAGELAMTRKHLIRDAKAESKPAKTMAFGTAISWKLRFVPPENRVRERWLRCENVMTDLETMDVVWRGIGHLESVRAFAKWFSERSEVSLLEIIFTLNNCLLYLITIFLDSAAECINNRNDYRFREIRRRGDLRDTSGNGRRRANWRL